MDVLNAEQHLGPLPFLGYETGHSQLQRWEAQKQDIIPTNLPKVKDRKNRIDRPGNQPSNMVYGEIGSDPLDASSIIGFFVEEMPSEIPASDTSTFLAK